MLQNHKQLFCCLVLISRTSVHPSIHPDEIIELWIGIHTSSSSSCSSWWSIYPSIHITHRHCHHLNVINIYKFRCCTPSQIPPFLQTTNLLTLSFTRQWRVKNILIGGTGIINGWYIYPSLCAMFFVLDKTRHCQFIAVDRYIGIYF